MRAVIQRTFRSVLSVDGEVKGSIRSGLTVFLAVCRGDTEEQADYFARKLVRLRVFRDENDKMNRSVLDVGGEILLVSQFSLAGKLGKGSGNRPDFGNAEDPGPRQSSLRKSGEQGARGGRRRGYGGVRRAYVHRAGAGRTPLLRFRVLNLCISTSFGCAEAQKRIAPRACSYYSAPTYVGPTSQEKLLYLT